MTARLGGLAAAFLLGAPVCAHAQGDQARDDWFPAYFDDESLSEEERHVFDDLSFDLDIALAEQPVDPRAKLWTYGHTTNVLTEFIYDPPPDGGAGGRWRVLVRRWDEQEVNRTFNRFFTAARVRELMRTMPRDNWWWGRALIQHWKVAEAIPVRRFAAEAEECPAIPRALEAFEAAAGSGFELYEWRSGDTALSDVGSVTIEAVGHFGGRPKESPTAEARLDLDRMAGMTTAVRFRPEGGPLRAWYRDTVVALEPCLKPQGRS